MNVSAVLQPAAQVRSKWRQFAGSRLPGIVMGLMVATLTVAVLYPHVVVTVPPGHVGVLWKRLWGFGIYCWCLVPPGTVLEPRELREEGLHLIWPWDALFIYDLRLQTITRSYNVISQDGLSLNASISARFQLQHDSVAQLHKFIGPDYPEILVSPVIGSRARDVISRFDAEQVYSTKRSEIQELIQQAAEKHLMKQLDQLIQPESNEQLPQKPTDTSAAPASTGQSPPASTDQSPPAPQRTILAVNRPVQVAASLHNAIQILDTLVLGIELPPAVVASINRKVEQYYIAQEYKFRVQREEWESTRKRTEATGIRDFQQIVSQGISDSYLRWRGIEATLQLAQSNNAKIVIIGSGKDGLPIILGNVDTPALPQTPAGAGTNPDAASRANPEAVPLEKTPPPGLPTPPDGKQVPPAAPDKPQSLLPRSLSEIQSMLLRFPANIRLTGPETGSSSP